MKRACLAISLLVALIGAVFAFQPERYQVITKKQGFFGLGGTEVTMIDKSNGATWKLVEDKWFQVQPPRPFQQKKKDLTIRSGSSLGSDPQKSAEEDLAVEEGKPSWVIE